MRSGRKLRRGVLFDLDGTLIKTTFPVSEAKLAVIKKLQELGIDTKDVTPMSTMMDIQGLTREGAQKSGATSHHEAERQVGEVLDGFDIASLSDARLQEDAKATLDSLVDAGFKLGIVTNSGRKGVEMALRRLKLAGYFATVVTRNDVRSLKPNPEGILKAAHALGCRSADIAFVGDSWADIRAANEAKVEAVALVGGLSLRERLESEHPDAMVGSLRELLRVLTSQEST